MLRVCEDLSRIFPQHTKVMAEVCEKVSKLPGVERIVLFGSYAKGTAEAESDVDLAVFFQTEEECLIAQYRALMRICANPELDIQAQPFHTYELLQPCGIIEEVITYGIELSAQ
ncbi:MAG TPA: nucleotidyltransferase domain-containing protein [Feifaniaceae bacterium]|nr:nucleotidyltransferase domain-containing protein [Feifaniaceae bacterium]